MIVKGARSVLSIGCGSGTTEFRLAESGLRVVAVPLDPIICSSAAARGVKMVYGQFRAARETLRDERFDCLLYLNVLHLDRDPAGVLSLFSDSLSGDSHGSHFRCQTCFVFRPSGVEFGMLRVIVVLKTMI